jgi:hypothetical protein
MAAFFCLLVIVGTAFFFSEILLAGFLILFPHLGERLIERWGWLGVYIGYVLLLPALAFGALWLALLASALSGSTREIPFLRRLTCKPLIVRFSSAANHLVWLLVPLITVFALYSTSLTRRSGEGAAVYFLYDDGISVPRWGYAMGLSRIALQAEKNWGMNCTVLDHLTRETLRQALTSGKVVILATHGSDGYAGTYCSPETLCVGPAPLQATMEMNNPRFLQTCILPYDAESWARLKEGKWDQWENVPVSSQLKLAYIFACNGGKKASEWEKHLAPARVITYNRISTLWDHAVWFAFTGPMQLEKLNEAVNGT